MRSSSSARVGTAGKGKLKVLLKGSGFQDYKRGNWESAEVDTW